MNELSRADFDFDVALSFAGEDREYASEVNDALKVGGARTFLDSDFLAETWGEDLVEFFDQVYRKRSLFAMIFISRHYAEKMWPRHERRSALARALDEKSAYILPVRLDDAELEGLRPTVGYLDARRVGIDGIVRAFLAKLAGRSTGQDGWPGDRTPRTLAECDQVLRDRPRGWEHLYFAGLLHAQKELLEAKYLDHELRYAAPSGERVEDTDAVAFMNHKIDEVRFLTTTLDSLFSADVQERAFGAPGVSGDPDRIRHLATRWNSTYAELLDWSARVRGVSRSELFNNLFQILARFADGPIEQYRAFVEDFVSQTDRIPTLGVGERLGVELTLTIALEEGIVEEHEAELAVISRRVKQMNQPG